MTHSLHAEGPDLSWHPDLSAVAGTPLAARRPAPLGGGTGLNSLEWALLLIIALCLHGATIGLIYLHSSRELSLTPPEVPPMTIEFATLAPPSSAAVPPMEAAPAPAPAEPAEPAAPIEPPAPVVPEEPAAPPTKPTSSVQPAPKKPTPAQPRKRSRSSPLTNQAATPAAAGPARQPSVEGAATLPVTAPSASADYLHNPAPDYPDAAVSRGFAGTVLLSVQVSAGGKPLSVQLYKSSGFEVLDQAALEAVRHWSFVPARQGNQARSGWVTIPVDFTLN